MGNNIQEDQTMTAVQEILKGAQKLPCPMTVCPGGRFHADDPDLWPILEYCGSLAVTHTSDERRLAIAVEAQKRGIETVLLMHSGLKYVLDDDYTADRAAYQKFHEEHLEICRDWGIRPACVIVEYEAEHDADGTVHVPSEEEIGNFFDMLERLARNANDTAPLPIGVYGVPYCQCISEGMRWHEHSKTWPDSIIGRVQMLCDMLYYAETAINGTVLNEDYWRLLANPSRPYLSMRKAMARHERTGDWGFYEERREEGDWRALGDVLRWAVKHRNLKACMMFQSFFDHRWDISEHMAQWLRWMAEGSTV
jgi:hypothetical protein